MPFKDAEHFVPSKGLESRPDRYDRIFISMAYNNTPGYT